MLCGLVPDEGAAPALERSREAASPVLGGGDSATSPAVRRKRRRREEAREPFEQLGVWEAELVELRRKRLGDGGRKDPAP